MSLFIHDGVEVETCDECGIDCDDLELCDAPGCEDVLCCVCLGRDFDCPTCEQDEYEEEGEEAP